MSIPENTELVGEGFLSVQKVMARYGVSKMAIWRWLQKPEMAFPKPVYLGSYRYWSKAELAAWEAAKLRERGAA